MELERIISYFKQLSAIPRQSGDEKAAGEFLVQFAKGAGLWAVQDAHNNVLVKKPGTAGREQEEPFVIQGHLDMVYVVAEEAQHNYENGIQVLDDGEFLCANGTSLGADNGIAISYAMMLMTAKDLSHPPLEFIFTAQEEVGLLGAEHLDVTELSGKRIMNLDTEEEGTFCSGCAGGVRSVMELPISREICNGNFYGIDVTIKGLKGGHSGMEIHLERGNAIQLMGRVIKAVEAYDVRIASVTAPGKSNAISSGAKMKLYAEAEQKGAVIKCLHNMETMFRNELAASDDVELLVQESGTVSACEVFTTETTKKICGILTLMPQGVMKMSMAAKGLVETSINTGSLEEKDGKLVLESALRSSVESEKYFVKDKVQMIADIFGASCEWFGEYPGWQFREESTLRDIAVKKYEELFGKEAKVEAIHAGLECGHWAAKIPGADILSMGPTMHDVHSPREKVSKQSIAHVWELIKAILGETMDSEELHEEAR